MKSRDMADYGFVHWVPFNRSNVRELLERTPEEPGVYVIRRATPITRRSGESDIVYIGSAANERGLRTRLRHYFHPGPTQRTNQRILTLMGDSQDFEVSFAVLPVRSAARALEGELLGRYEKEHDELPPENDRRA